MENNQNIELKIGYNPYCFTSLSLERYFKDYFTLVPIHDEIISKKISRKVNNKFYFIKDHFTGKVLNLRLIKF